MNEKLKKLIEDYGHHMYNLGEDSGDDYERDQMGKAYARLHVYLRWGEKPAIDPCADCGDHDAKK